MPAGLKRSELLLAMGLLALGVALGACREFLAINLNYQLDHVLRGTRYSYAHSLAQGWWAGMDAAALLRLKWGLAGLFILANAALTVVMARLLFGAGRLLPTVLGFYGLVTLLALGFHGLAAIRPTLAPVALQLLHLVQYPVPLVVLLAVRAVPRAGQKA